MKLGSEITDLRYEDRLVIVEISGEEGLKVDRVVLATPASVARTFLGMLEQSLGPGVEDGEDERVRIGFMKKALSQVRYKVRARLLYGLVR